MDIYSKHIKRLTSELGNLPGVGAKTAQRLAFYIVNMPKEKVDSLTEAITKAKESVKFCKKCFCLTDSELCPICMDETRDKKTIMVVEETKDMAAYEKISKYDGIYHVLHGVISPMMGTEASDIKLKELLERLSKEDVKEVIIATNSSLEGETTAMYISRLIKPTGIRVSRIASGVPVGSDIEYTDEITLLRALEGRITL